MSQPKKSSPTVIPQPKQAADAQKSQGSQAPLSSEQLKKMDAYWRAANYLSVGQIYLFDNPLLKEPLKREHIKPRLLGHWGTTPGLNFIYVHLNRIIKEHDLQHDLCNRPGPWRAGHRRQCLPGGHIHRGLSQYQPG